MQCVTDGGTWLAGPLAEYIENLQISDGESTASIKQIRQVFTKENGQLVARGGWTLDNNGRIVSIAGYNDGETGHIDIGADLLRFGVVVDGAFVPTSYIDNADPANPVQVIRGRLVLGDGHTVNSLEDIRAQDGKDGADGRNGIDGQDGADGSNGIDGQDGADGSRGSIEVQVATSSGAWSDSVANSSVPGAPVIHDRVTIYKSSDPATQTTKRFNGSSWVSYTLQVHGSAIIDDTLDARAIRAGSRMESPRIDLIGGAFMKIELASGFGPDNLWYWYGPKIMSGGLPNLDALTKANGIEWKDTAGNAYFGGAITSGVLSTALTTSDLSSSANVTIGPFGS
ncbi:MAG: hypothetical protein NZ738_00190, partial [Oceanospirillaceae bacterium]|nr:hypothetical protein [Oceanospirillaceae bacterium]